MRHIVSRNSILAPHTLIIILFCYLLLLINRFLEGKVSALPHPGADWSAFLQKVKELNATAPKVFCANTEKMKPWLDTKKLAKIYASGNGSSNVCVLS